MDQVVEFLTHLVQSIDFANIGVGVVLAGILVSAYMVWTPNKYVYNFGFKLGKKKSALGIKLIGKNSWEKIENNYTGTLSALANGMIDGMKSDNK